MAHINVLDENTINQIAAGEVIERPSSVVKELMENAVDAKSTAVTVEIREGGLSLIRVTDNGSGIPADEVPTAFLRHATSKITNALDLITVSSLGFRGEALSSIASVAKVELITKTSDGMSGCRYVIEGGKELTKEEVGAPDGTTFLVRDLFYNTPARRKFMKTAITEGTHVAEYVEKLALSHPEVSVRLIQNNQTKLHTTGNNNLKDIIYTIFGREIAANLLEVAGGDNTVTVNGYIGKPVIARGNRSFENYFINGRFIKSPIISKAIEDAYKPYMMQHKYPFTVLHFRIDPNLIDVNVHPAKMELRFRDGEMIYRMIYHSLSLALSGKELIPAVESAAPKAMPEEMRKPLNSIKPAEMARPVNPVKPAEMARPMNSVKPAEMEKPAESLNSVNTIKPAESMKPALSPDFLDEVFREKPVQPKPSLKPVRPVLPTPEPFEVKRKETIIREDKASYGPIINNKPVEKEEISVENPVQMQLFEDKLLSEEARPKHRVIGQLFDTYWLIEYNNNLYIIDQHAAHEKVLYERTMKSLKNREYTSQMIAPPIILTLNPQEELVLSQYKDAFTSIGFEIEHFGGRSYSVHAVPDNLFSIAKKDLLIEMLDSIGNFNDKMTPDIIKDRVATMSCKAAVKGNNRLSTEEANALIDELLKLDNPYACPHGRPTIISMSKYELEKKFKRIVT